VAASNSNLEKAELLILIESPEFKEIQRSIAAILNQYRDDENSSSYMPHYVLDFYSDGSGCICSGDKDYINGDNIVEYN
jgi:hypothetical protein